MDQAERNKAVDESRRIWSIRTTMINLFADLPTNLPEELVDVFVDNKHVRIERIISTGQASPDDFWYDLEEAEWVVVLKGETKLLFEGDDEPIHMRPGDFVNIPAHRKHRVEWTMPDEPTVWLAVIYRADIMTLEQPDDS